MDTTPTTPAVLSLARMARRLGVTQQWLRAEAEAGRVPAIRVSSTRWLFAPTAVESALADRAAQGGPTDA